MRKILIALSLFVASSAVASTFYVWTNSPSPAEPYDTWPTASRSLQQAVNLAGDNDTVWVTNGLYWGSGTITPGGVLPNVLVITNKIAVRSVNGPSNTVIIGTSDTYTNGDNAVRCAFVSQGWLYGFTLTNGHTMTNSGDFNQSGGGALCADGGTISGCIIVNCSADSYGGGVSVYGQGTVNNCTVINNESRYSGGGVYGGTVTVCQVTGNIALLGEGGGIYATKVIGGTVVSNWSGGEGGGIYASEIARDCTVTDNYATYRGGGISAPAITNCIIRRNSSYRGGGAYWKTEGSLLDGYNPAAKMGKCTITDNTAFMGGGIYQFKLAEDCDILRNTATNYGGGALGSECINCDICDNRALTGSGGGLIGGNYTGGARQYSRLCTITNNQAGDNGGGVNMCTVSDSTIANNSATNFGGGVSGGRYTNCIIRDNSADRGGGNYGGDITDCLIKDNTASDGAGMCYGYALRCNITGNIATNQGGGSWSGTATDCLITSNSANLGGGVHSGFVNGGVISHNSAVLDGGGVMWGTLTNCLIVNNVGQWGGGALGCVLSYCTVASNSANWGGGTYDGIIRNSIIYHNIASGGGSNYYNYWEPADFSYTCLAPVTNGVGNIFTDPEFLDWPSGNFRLLFSSPCIDAADPSIPLGFDNDGLRRPLDGDNDGSNRVDMGCYEHASVFGDSDNDGLGDSNEVYNVGTDPLDPDSDKDTQIDGDEYFAGTDPTDKTEWFRITNSTMLSDNCVFSWKGLAGKAYCVQTTTDLFDTNSWANVAEPAYTNYVGLGSTILYSNLLSGTKRYFRVKVR